MQIKAMGDTVIIRKTPDLTVGTYSIGGTISYQVPEKDSTSLTIDKAIYTAFRIDDIDKVQVDMDLINMYADDSAYKMKISVDTDVLGYLGTAAHADNIGSTAGAISANIDMGTATSGPLSIDATNAITKIVEVNQVLDEANVDSADRFIILPAWYVALLKVGDLKRADITGDSTGVLRSGLIGMVDRTMIYQSNNLTVTGAGETLIVAGTKEASTFAAQISKVDTLQIPDSFGSYWRSLLVYGRKVVQPTALVNMVAKRA